MELRAWVLVAFCMGFVSTPDTAEGAIPQWYTGFVDQVQISSTGELIVFFQATSNHDCGTKRLDFISSGTAEGKSFLSQHCCLGRHKEKLCAS